jgi:hypothetical protein
VAEVQFDFGEVDVLLVNAGIFEPALVSQKSG